MKTLTAQYKAAIANGTFRLATFLKMTRRDGVVMAATTHDRNLTVGSIQYLASAGGTMSDVQTTAALSVSNAEMRGLLNLDSITEVDLRAGLYDYAAVHIFRANVDDLTHGTESVLDGHIGQVTTERSTFVVEVQGLAKQLGRTQGRVCVPLCNANLGDARCKVELTPFRVSGALTGVSLDNTTMFDDARTEPGASGGVAVIGVSNTNPGVVTLGAPLTVPNGSGIVLAGIVGPASLNTTTIVRNLASDGLSFELGVDTTDTAVYPPYVSGGTVTPLGGDSGYFDYGLFTALSGFCINRSMEVKAYSPGQWTLQLPMPYLMRVGDEYEMTAGCNKQIATCHIKFDNHLNFRGRPYVGGQDKLMQMGRQG